MEEGDTLNFTNFFSIESMFKTEKTSITANSRLLKEQVDTPADHVKFEETLIQENNQTKVELAVNFVNLVAGIYQINFITNGSKSWNSKAGDNYFFTLNPQSVELE